jgi:elongation factor G
MDDIVKYMPAPNNRKVAGIDLKTNEVFEADYDFSKTKSAYIFKTIVDPFIGKYSFIKVMSGVLKTDDLLYNDEKSVEEKIGKIYYTLGKRDEDEKLMQEACHYFDSAIKIYNELGNKSAAASAKNLLAKIKDYLD